MSMPLTSLLSEVETRQSRAEQTTFITQNADDLPPDRPPLLTHRSALLSLHIDNNSFRDLRVHSMHRKPSAMALALHSNRSTACGSRHARATHRNVNTLQLSSKKFGFGPARLMNVCFLPETAKAKRRKEKHDPTQDFTL